MSYQMCPGCACLQHQIAAYFLIRRENFAASSASFFAPDVLATALRRASGNVGLDVIRVYASMSV